MPESTHLLDQPGTYRITATITTRGRLYDPTSDREVYEHLRAAINDGGDIEITDLEYDPGFTQADLEAERAEYQFEQEREWEYEHDEY